MFVLQNSVMLREFFFSISLACYCMFEYSCAKTNLEEKLDLFVPALEPVEILLSNLSIAGFVISVAVPYYFAN